MNARATDIASVVRATSRRRAVAGLLFGAWFTAGAQQRADRPTPGEWGDRGDGSYANPVMPGDFSDLDAIRVGRDYYAISSTFQYSPGMAVLHSKDLVNWEIIGHVVDDLTRIDAQLNWDRMSRAGRGIWAGSIRFHDGKYRVYFGTPDQGVFVSTAKHPSGPWTTPRVVLAAAGWDDPCPFWDDDGRAYLVATHFAAESPGGTTYNIHLFSMNRAGDGLLTDSDRIIHRSRGSEANKLYKINGWYFHYYSEVTAEGRVGMMARARRLDGPWENRQVIHVHAAVDKEPNQGGLIQLPSGAWYFVSHQGRGDWEGRAGVLLPVTWNDGWPIIGAVGADGVGSMVWHHAKPVPHSGLTNLAVSDEFDGRRLKPQWEWNYQPRDGKWSLLERPGYLRLHAFAPLHGGGFFAIGNVLTQRSMRTLRSEVTAKLDLTGIADGQEAGLAHYAKTFCTLGVVQAGGARTLSFNDNGRKTLAPMGPKAVLWLRSTWDYDGVMQFSYSVDGSSFIPFGEPCQLTWGSYRGDRVGVFTTGERGYVDLDSFQYSVRR